MARLLRLVGLRIRSGKTRALAYEMRVYPFINDSGGEKMVLMNVVGGVLKRYSTRALDNWY